ncbi:hypothetical protein [Actinoplanes sp. NPDC049802]|uniref:hypothetical protein n=1 Tax=Actinoplanes sp. NPDC049802 TaxID=3154742 RepID=UPI0033C54C68
MTPEVEAELERLADKVHATLRLAGFNPQFRDFSIDQDLAGAVVEIEVESGNEGVFVYWQTSVPLTQAVVKAVRARDSADRACEINGDITEGMLDALLAILTSAGFEVEEAGGYRDLQVQVTGVRGETLDTLITS